MSLKGRRGVSSAAAIGIALVAILAASMVAYTDNTQTLNDQITNLQGQVNSLSSGVPASGGQYGDWAEQTCNTTVGSTSVTLVAKTAEIQIAQGVTYNAWTFNGTVPGPTIFVKQCELVHFTLINNDTMPHSIDFHAAEVNWATVYAPVAPGKSLSFDFAPAYPGIFMYHCGVPPVLEHIANGMYGVIIVNGTGPDALRPAPGGQYVIIESEFYPSSHPNADGSYSGNYTDMLAATPQYVVFNGEAFKYQTTPLVDQHNEHVRLNVINEGPNLCEAIHVRGAIMDTVYIDGNPSNVLHGVQTLSIPPAGGAIVDMYFKDPGGENPFVNHSFADMQKGAMGLFQVENVTGALSTSTTPTTTSTPAPGGPVVTILPLSGMLENAPYYSPQVVTVVIGVNNTVTWVNNDDVPHTVTASDGSFNSGNMNAGQSWTHMFTTPGTYNYYCTYHPWMKGTVIVLAASS